MVVGMLGVVCANQRLIMIIMLKCYLNAMLSIICHVLFMKFFYISLLWLTYPHLMFVCLLYVRKSYNVCVI